MLKHTRILFYPLMGWRGVQASKATEALVTLCSWEFLVGGQERRFSCHAGAKVATKREHDTCACFDVSLTVVFIKTLR
jgi:hypothetical protein